MKNSTLILALILQILSQTAKTQTQQKPLNSSNHSLELNQKSAKENYISNQNYLSVHSLNDYKNYYGDSLKGFDEEKIKVELINHGVYGEEYLHYIKTVKRDYINKKYKIGTVPSPVNTQTNSPQTNGKVIGGGGSVNFAPCTNEDFESSTPGQYTTGNAITGWTISSQAANSCATNTVWGSGSPKMWIVQTPITGIPSITNLGASPLGGSLIAQMNNTVSPLSLRTKMATTFPVTLSNTLFQFAYAGVYQDGGHNCCEQPALQVKMYDCSGNPMACSSLSLNAVGSNCPNGATGYTVTGGTSWTNWDVKFIDLTPFIGTCVTIEIINSDCIFGGHYGITYIDAQCGGQLIGGCFPVTTGTLLPNTTSYCAGSNLAQIAAPLGYVAYQWYGPGMVPIAVPAGTNQIISISNPTPGAVFTVDLTTASGCVYTTTNSITTSTVNIAGIGSTPSCPGGASGTATVVGNGSGSGYNYSWTNSSNSVVGTASVATGLAPGVYSITISGLGSAGCGTAVATVTITTGPQGVISLLKPFCGSSPAYLGTNGGSNFQWYGSSGAVPASSGGTAQTYSIASPSSGSIVTLTYITAQNCQDSVRFTLVATSPGFVLPASISSVCPGGTNGIGQINMAMAAGAPPGSNTLGITSIGSTPAYNVTIPQTATTSFSLTGLSAGSYSVNAFDGSCYYNSTFTVNTFVFNYSVSPNSPTLCPGNCIAAGVSFSSAVSLNQFSYSWSPTTYLAGNNGTSQSTIICPTLTPGSQTNLVYTIVVTPSVINCPISKTISIIAINPAVPTISVIPELCNNSTPYTIQTNPTGGIFSTGFVGANSPVSQTTGLITPSHTNIVIGVNTVTYAISVGGCVAKKTATYEISKFWTSALTTTVPPQCETNSPFNLMNIVQNTVNGSWSGTGVGSNSFIPTFLSNGVYTLTYSCFSLPDTNACPSSTTLLVSVTKTITPSILPVSEFCDNAAAFNMTVSPSGGTWQVAGGISSTGIITPTSITVSSLTANYSVAIGPCINYASSILHISHFNTAALTATVPHLCYNSNPFNLMSIVQSTVNGAWNGLAGVSSNSFITNGLASNTYIISYNTSSYPNAALCPDTKTIAVSVLNPPTPTITPVSTICNNATSFNLNALPNNGHWTATSYLNSNGVFSPSLCAVGNNAIQYVSGTNTCNVQQTQFISVEAFRPATIMSPIGDLCNNTSPLNLSPITLNNSGIWSGNGISGNYFNPVLSGAGTFTLTYSTTSSPSGLCPDVAITSVKVFSLAAPEITKVESVCNNSMPVQLQVSPVGGLFGGANSGIVDQSGLFHPSGALTGDNIINYSITSGPCIAYAQTIIRVEKFIAADFEKLAGPFCKTAQSVNLNSFAQHSNGAWSGPGVIGTMFDPTLANIGNTNVILHTTYSYPSGKLCPDTASMRIEVRNIPNVSAFANIESGCAPLEVVFHSPNVNSGKGKWTIGNAEKSFEGLDLVHTFISPGTYTAVFNYEDAIGCKALPAFAKPVVVHETPQADFDLPEQIMISDPKVQAINHTNEIGNNKYQWSIINSTETSTEVNPIFEFKKAGKYTIHLTSTSMYNCKSEMSRTLLVKNNFNIYIPNAFSPNYDGLNDVFQPVFAPYGLDEASFEMEIYDRWGHSLFQTRDITKGWNGSAKKSDQILSVGIYMYKIKYKDLEGNLYSHDGHLNLMH